MAYGRIYIENLRKLAEEEKISTNIEVTEITKFPDVLTIKSNLDEKQIKDELLQVVDEAINQLINMRQNEGKKISEDILEKISHEKLISETRKNGSNYFG